MKKTGIAAIDAHAGPDPDAPKRKSCTDLGIVTFDNFGSDMCREWRVADFLERRGFSYAHGAPGSGKSLFAMDLGMHVAAGLAWHGRKVEHTGVLYLAYERFEETRLRGIAFRKHHGLSGLPFGLRACSGPDFRDWKTAVPLITDLINALADEFSLAVDLMIVDTLSMSLCGGSDSEPRDMQALVYTVNELRQRHRDLHPLFVHHEPAEGTGSRGRGHTSVYGNVDTGMHVEKNGNICTAVIRKANNGTEGQTVSFAFTSVVTGVDKDGKETTAPVAVSSDNAKPARRTRAKKALPDAARVAFDALADIIVKSGEQFASEHAPHHCTAVTMNVWREHARQRGGLCKSDNTDSWGAAFRRAVDRLNAEHWIGIYGSHVWIARHEQPPQ
jgi:hypothetical protein